ncbi:MAG: hypothetical protein WA814_05280 [Candidatus Baltobacteraceae bacterium]
MPFIFALGALAIVAAIFQLFLRYDYIENSHVVLRIDRITHEVCRVTREGLNCSPGSPSPSTSRSVSTSTSLSTSVAPAKGER